MSELTQERDDLNEDEALESGHPEQEQDHRAQLMAFLEEVDIDLKTALDAVASLGIDTTDAGEKVSDLSSGMAKKIYTTLSEHKEKRKEYLKRWKKILRMVQKGSVKITTRLTREQLEFIQKLNEPKMELVLLDPDDAEVDNERSDINGRLVADGTAYTFNYHPEFGMFLRRQFLD